MPVDVESRTRWMRTLALAEVAALRAAWERWEPRPAVLDLRGPQAGLVMVRGRVDAAGHRFNLGEATVTRSTVRLSGEPMTDDVVGSAYVLGGDLEHARLAAVFDGLLADDGQRERALREVVEPLREAQDAQDRARRRDSRSTVVDFFTVAREHE